MLEQSMREIKVLCEPANAPDSINIDVSALRVGESLHVSDLKVDDGIEIHASGESVVAHVVVIKEAVLEPQVEDGAEPTVDGEAATEAAPETEGDGGGDGE